MRKRYDDDVIMIIIAILNAIIVIFVDFFNDVCAKSSARQIIISIFEYVLIFLLTIIDHKYDLNLIISLYIKSLSCF